MKSLHVASVCLSLASLLAAAPASAKILKTRRPGQYKELALTVGSGFEFETDGEESEYGFPFLVEYGFTKMLKLSAEPSYVLVRKKKGGSISGPGDLETTLTCEFPTERRYRPGLALEGVFKWPTARRGGEAAAEAGGCPGAVGDPRTVSRCLRSPARLLPFAKIEFPAGHRLP